jgi:hypothetical protein
MRYTKVEFKDNHAVLSLPCRSGVEKIQVSHGDAWMVIAIQEMVKFKHDSKVWVNRLP